MHFPTALTRQKSNDSLGPRKHTPWIASPLAQRPSSHNGDSEETKSAAAERVVEFDESQHDLYLHRTHTEEPLFREHHESSTVELFYDLFFVANLATFTSNHDIVDASSLKNYLGFFTLLWFTWLQYSLFDVRFSTDSIFNRLCKAVSFGVMTGFAVCGAIYDQSNVEENAKAFRAMALILMVSRLALVGQYAVVLFYVRKYKNTIWPLGLTMLALFVGAMVYLGTFFGFTANSASFPIERGSGPKTYAAWYALACLEALAVIAFSCYWRVVSFRHTHLVERIGLLTLIIMGEGIIGMTKSVSTILQTASSVGASDIGTIVAAVLLIYFIWVLYFDQIEHDRFGTIRQQIWAILHFPLHVAILLTVEGSTTLILWNIIKNISDWLFDWLPCPGGNTDDPTFGFLTAEGLVSYINKTIVVFNSAFKKANISTTYDYNADLVALKNIKAPFNSTDWINEAWDLEDKIFFGVYDWFNNQFDIEAPESSTRTASTGNTSFAEATERLQEAEALFNVFETVFYYFFIAAGAFLVILAVMYWFGKTHKSRAEYVSMLVRVVAGLAVMVGLYSGTDTVLAGNFDYSSWLIPVVTLSYFAVIVLDNLLVWHSNKTVGRLTSTNRHEVFSKVDGTTKRTDSSGSSGEDSG